MYIKGKRGQSTVEYVLLVTAVLAVIIAFTTSTNKNGFQGQLNTTLSSVTNGISTESDQLVTPWGGTNAVSNVTAPYSVPVCPPGVTCN